MNAINLSGFTNKDTLQKSEEGVYADTPANRKLGRVGQKYAESQSTIDKGPTEKLQNEWFKPVEVEGATVKVNYEEGVQNRGEIGTVISSKDKKVTIKFNSGDIQTINRVYLSPIKELSSEQKIFLSELITVTEELMKQKYSSNFIISNISSALCEVKQYLNQSKIDKVNIDMSYIKEAAILMAKKYSKKYSRFIWD